ncbi:MAG: Ig-like domain-containing protein [Acutalibacteraceae bacterium]|nr:Ig-like domain-containing protein [Acutalibacteraceae bacterium]
MNKKLNKVLMVILAVIIILSSAPISSIASIGSDSSVAVVAQAASKKTHLNKTRKSIYIGKKYTLKLIDKKGKTISSSKVKWSRSNKSVASVSKKGVVTGKKAGKIKITAKYKGKKYTAVITVKSAVSVSSSKVTFKAGETSKKTIKVTCKDNKGIKWKTVEGSGIVKLSQAKKWKNDSKSLYITPTGKKFGTVKIKIYSAENSKSYTYLTVDVKKPYTLKIRNSLPCIIHNYKSQEDLKNFIRDSSLIIRKVTYKTPDTKTMNVTVEFEAGYSENIESYYFIKYRVFDKDGYIVESDTIKSKLMMVGDKSKAEIALKNLKNGAYTIEFRDYIGNAPANTPDTENNPPAVDETTQNKPADKFDTEALTMYQNAVKKINETGCAGYSKKSWQSVEAFSISGNVALQDTLKSLIEGFITTEADAEALLCEKGSQDAKNNMPLSNCSEDAVESVTKTSSGSNTIVTIVLKDQINPAKTDTDGLNVMSKDILYMEDVYDVINNDHTVSLLVKDFDNAKVTYKNYTIKATLNQNGDIVAIEHSCSADISADMQTMMGNMSAYGTLGFYSKYYGFKY